MMLMEKILMKKIQMKEINYRMYLVFMFKAFRLILSDSKNTRITYVTDITCIIFKTNKKNLFISFFSIYKNDK